MNKRAKEPKKPEEVTHYIRAWRKEKGLTISELADRSKLGSSMISQIELGRSTCSLQALARIAAALGQTPGTLLDHDPAQGSSMVASLASRRLSKMECCDILIEMQHRLLAFREGRDHFGL